MMKKELRSQPSKYDSQGIKFGAKLEVVTKDICEGDEVFVAPCRKFPDGVKATIAQVMLPGFLFRVQVKGFDYLHGPYCAKELEKVIEKPKEPSVTEKPKGVRKFSMRHRRSITR